MKASRRSCSACSPPPRPARCTPTRSRPSPYRSTRTSRRRGQSTTRANRTGANPGRPSIVSPPRLFPPACRLADFVASPVLHPRDHHPAPAPPPFAVIHPRPNRSARSWDDYSVTISASHTDENVMFEIEDLHTGVEGYRNDAMSLHLFPQVPPDHLPPACPPAAATSSALFLAPGLVCFGSCLTRHATGHSPSRPTACRGRRR